MFLRNPLKGDMYRNGKNCYIVDPSSNKTQVFVNKNNILRPWTHVDGEDAKLSIAIDLLNKYCSSVVPNNEVYIPAPLDSISQDNDAKMEFGLNDDSWITPFLENPERASSAVPGNEVPIPDDVSMAPFSLSSPGSMGVFAGTSSDQNELNELPPLELNFNPWS